MSWPTLKRHCRKRKTELPPGDAFAVWQLAKVLGCNRSHVSALVESGEVDAFHLRGKGANRSIIRVPRAALIEFLEKRQSTGGNKARAAKHVRISPTHSRRHQHQPMRCWRFCGAPEREIVRFYRLRSFESLKSRFRCFFTCLTRYWRPSVSSNRKSVRLVNEFGSMSIVGSAVMFSLNFSCS
jgi:hypothetical protein